MCIRDRNVLNAGLLGKGAGHAVLRLSRRDGIDLRAAAQRIADDPTVLDGLFDGSSLPSARATALQGAHHEH